jgi:hypothetical protein
MKENDDKGENAQKKSVHSYSQLVVKERPLTNKSCVEFCRTQGAAVHVC